MSVSYRVRSAAALLADLAVFSLNRTELKKAFARSPLADPPPPGLCPACATTMTPLLRMPLGCPESPGDRRSTLLWLEDAEALARDPARTSRAARAAGLRLIVPWNRCPDCGTAAVGVRLGAEHLSRYYARVQPRERAADARRAATKTLHAMCLASRLAPGARVLEIGAAEGLAAAALAEKGFEVWVEEPDEAHRRALAGKGLRFVEGGWAGGGARFDAILLHHVLEHVEDPAGLLTAAARALKPGGCLLAQVPDLEGQLAGYRRHARTCPLWKLNGAAWIAPAEGIEEAGYPWLDALNTDHVAAFTARGLRLAAGRAGLAVDEVLRADPSRVRADAARWAWPVDPETGSPPNGLTLWAHKFI
ncbi:MAG TPA: hypothetical protein DCZ01_05095 [Elusimicrobia bacterium]|nr:MAG: hypothetical protein A2040_03595 [Rhodocyclales bacterium GWA2_65_19]HAZ07900.1 hypothetical protein [Elusimicrobiota bacterium]